MPDTLLPSAAFAAGPTFPLSPTEFVDRLLAAARPAIDEKGNIVSKPKAVKALLPLIGHYTVADAAMALALLHGALAVWPPTTDEDDDCPRFNTLCHVSWLLEEFACLADASGPLCITGRLYLLEQAAADDAWALPHPDKAIYLTRHDTKKQCRGRFSRVTFAGLERSSGAPSWLYRASQEAGELNFSELEDLFGTPTPKST